MSLPPSSKVRQTVKNFGTNIRYHFGTNIWDIRMNVCTYVRTAKATFRGGYPT